MKKHIQTIIKKAPDLPMQAAQSSFEILVSSWAEYKRISEVEDTKRSAISALKDVKLEQIGAQRAILEQYLAKTFEERATTIHNFFEVLDKGIENGDSSLISNAIGAIVDITKQSPLAGARELIGAFYDPEVKTIEI
ncbi:hypothetical protein HWE02_14500 [Pseudomonas oryzihabitans]|uniref:hypothetical protein n=1 Tax=Pseudomonas oryzihabitans TaxID=47885 RepID=UPI001F52239A|nr:hypothetical protein [Pseudomonas oryzihabitans]MCI1010473.1 hypothetical protein [Pseudomonas oryzihabitans]